MTVRGKVAIELGVIAILTTIFLVLAPKRNPAVDVGLAGFALVLVALSSHYTKNTIWATSPAPVAQNRFKRCVVVTFWVTVPTTLLFFLIGAIIACQHGGWPEAAHRVFNWRVPVAFCCYLPWALMQQSLLQFYLLGRLLALFPKQLRLLPFIITGACFGLVHLPDVWTAAVTVAAGMVWSLIYYRYRLLLPLAFSHAALGTAFYYGIFGHDLAAEWRAILP
jgi:membrane protease YdiL (CAAX protease family)